MDEQKEIPVIAAEIEETASAAAAADPRIAELDRRLRDLEAAIGDLRTVGAHASAAAEKPVAAGRKTLGVPVTALLAKQGVSLDENVSLQAGSLDAAMGSLSIEQRIAVKSQMMRAGLL